MSKLIKYMIYLVILAISGIVLYAYVGPFFGVDFSAQQNEIRIPVVLDAD